MKLIKYNEISEYQFINYIYEWETRDELIVPSATQRNGKSFHILLKQWEKEEKFENSKAGLVPATLYFFENDDKSIVGAIHFRHKLNPKLLQCGGHIGFGIKPTLRRRGYASYMLSELLKVLSQKEASKVLLTCNDSNIGSIKTIEKNNGVLDNKAIYEGSLIRRYWIDLEKCK